MAYNKKSVGNHGEQLVSDKLEREGYAIQARNYTKRYGEVDIIASKEDVIAFVEVKNRFNPLFDMTELIPRSKQKKLAAVAKAFLAHYHTTEVTCRFDVALVTNSQKITYIENAFTHE
jgi:putative endonuclease